MVENKIFENFLKRNIWAIVKNLARILMTLDIYKDVKMISINVDTILVVLAVDLLPYDVK